MAQGQEDVSVMASAGSCSGGWDGGGQMTVGNDTGLGPVLSSPQVSFLLTPQISEKPAHTPFV